MKKQMVMAVMILMFLAEGCSGHTEGSVEKAEPVTGIRETEERGQEATEGRTLEETVCPGTERMAGTETMEAETEGQGQNKSKMEAGSRSAAVAATEDVETSATANSGKRIPTVSANASKEDSGRLAVTPTKEAVQSSPAALTEPSGTVPSVETEPDPENLPETQLEPETQPEPETPAEALPVTEPETEAPPESQPEPKTAYDYPFDMDSIRSDCIGIGQGMGLALDGSLTPGNAAWWNPVTASQSNQGAGLKQSLKSYIAFHTSGNLAGYGMDEITIFNIYCEPRGNGEYSVYFLFG